jgi:enoyl-CoA hydratase
MTHDPSGYPVEMTSLSVELREDIALITLTARGKVSRQGPDFWRELPALMAWLSDAPHVRAVVITGQGEGFSMGLDLMAMAMEIGPLLAPGTGVRERGALLKLIKRMQDAISSVARCEKPVIAAIHGWCIGAGVDLASACDIRLCSADARFSVREVKMAIVADTGALARLPRIIGEGATRELALTGDDIAAERALSLGLVTQLHPDHDALMAAALGMAKRIAANSPHTVRGVKQVLNHRSERAAQDSLDHVTLWNSAFLPSRDLVEALDAFASKRSPSFSGE